MNAKEELLRHIKSRKVTFVSIAYRDHYGGTVTRIRGKLREVLPLLDFEYDDGFGSQKLFGFIWYTGGTWSERGEYDGSEWWVYQCKPDKNAEIECH